MAKLSLNVPYLLLTGIILLAILIVFAWYRPLWIEVQSRRAELETTQQQLAERQAFLVAVDRKRTELAQQADYERQLDVVLPADAAVDDITRLLHRTSQVAGVTITNISNDSANEQSNVVTARESNQELVGIPTNVVPLAFKVNVLGSYQQLRTWHEQLEKSPRLIDVTALNYKITGPDQVSADMTLRLFHFAGGQ
ncbi:MAG: type 4a pilus biogenesis protein PilO [Candidatus Andersenbacteria bacterium]